MLLKEALAFKQVEFRSLCIIKMTSFRLLPVTNDTHDTKLIYQVDLIFTDGVEVTTRSNVNLTVRYAGQKFEIKSSVLCNLIL